MLYRPVAFQWARRVAGALSVLGLVNAAHAKPYIYVAFHDLNAVGVYDVGTNTWRPPIAVGSAPVAVAAAPAQRTLYVSNFSSNTVSAIRVADRAVVGTISVGNRPMGIAVAPSQPRAYVANFGDGTVSVINTQTNAVLSTIIVGANPSALAVSASGDRVFVANTGSNSVAVIDAASNTVAATITFATATEILPRPYAIAHVGSGAGSRLLVASNNNAKVEVLDGATYAPLASINVGAHPTAIAVVNANKAYVLNSFDATISVIDPTAGTLIAGPISATAGAVSLASNASGTLAALTAYPNHIATINTSSNAVAAPIAIPGATKSPLTLGAFVVDPAYECALDVNADNAFNAQDATLIARYVLGFRSSALVSGFSGLDAVAITNQLSTLNLDADGDGSVKAQTDGLLFARAADLRIGNALIENARNVGPPMPPGLRSATLILQWILDTHGVNCLP